MNIERVTGVRSVELGVPDLRKSVDFYTRIWGLEPAGGEADAVFLRGTGREHHLLTLRERPRPTFISVDCAAPNHATVDKLCARARAYGVRVEGDPGQLPRSAGGGYGFRFQTPDGLPMSVSADLGQHTDTVADRSRPAKISHVVLNSARTDEQIAFFADCLGFQLTDSSHMMEFLRCSSDHHSIAIFRNNGPSLNHIAYEVPNIDGLMRGSGRLKQNGFNIEWGVGRHGPGNNVFSYFIEPNGFVTEYTTEVDQIDEATHIAQDPAFWDKLPNKPDRWGLAGPISNRMQAAMSGALYQGEAPADERCEDVMARKLG